MLPLLILILFVALAVSAYLRMTRHFGLFKSLGLPEHRPVPFLGCWEILSMLNGRWAFAIVCREISELYRRHKVVGYYEFATPVLVVNDVDLAKRVLVKDFEYFADRRSHRVMNPRPGGTNQYWNTFLSNLRGEEWRQARAALSPTFTTAKIKYMNASLNRNASDMLTYLETECDGGRADVDAKLLVWMLTLENSATCQFGVKANVFNKNADDTFRIMLKKLHGFESPFPVAMRFLSAYMFPNWVEKFNIELMDGEAGPFVVNTVKQAMAARRSNMMASKSKTEKDLIDLMMEALDEWTAQERGNKANLVNEENAEVILIGSLLQFFLASQETTSSFSAFALYHIAKDPDVQERLQREIDDALARNNGIFSYSLVQEELPYLEMVVNESLRMYHPSDLERVCVKDYTLPGSDITIPKGVVIQVPTTVLHRSAEFFPKPETFDPELHFGPDSTFKREGGNAAFAFQPFGQGPRNCIGMRFALVQMKNTMAHLLAAYNISLSPDMMDPDRKIVYKRWSISWDAVGGIWLRFRQREHTALAPSA